MRLAWEDRLSNDEVCHRMLDASSRHLNDVNALHYLRQLRNVLRVPLLHLPSRADLHVLGKAVSLRRGLEA